MFKTFLLFLMLSIGVHAQTTVSFPQDFLFGIANAPGHVEDMLDDIWMAFGRDGNIRAFSNQTLPEERLRFWTQPEVEINLAHELGAQVFRLGVDWGRIHTAPGVFDQATIDRYKEIIQMIRAKNMKVMLTLFHFTVPKWVQNEGGWTNDETKTHFIQFSKLIMSEFGPMVDFWITFNEPQIFATMAYTFGFFPPGIKGNVITTIHSLKEMIRAHKEIYTWAHKNLKSPLIGIAQHMGHHTGRGVLNKTISKFTGGFMNWYFPNRIKGYMDYFGFNYYGAEWIKGAAISMDPKEEYSEAGRAIDPKGLYLISKKIKKKFGDLPQFITENGVADATDFIRPSYLIQHLRVVDKLRSENIKMMGYIYWTITDNMEWADGYCPKFGLVAVDRDNNLNRVIRPSFYLYQKIIREREISVEMQDTAWNLLQSHVGEARPFCRSEDGKTGLDVPVERLIRDNDWRF
jgi:beta-glucosidase/6-phospho-beta-glucosidase/beta-galactosidase